ncbi:MAG TPA: hypothetical protein VH986_09225 [Acidimicrobiia bacterium]
MDPIPAVERDIGFDLARRAALVAPAVLLVAFLVAGTEGLAGAAIALAVVAGNFVAGALSLAWATKRGPGVLGAVALGGFVVRMAVVVGVLVLVKSSSAVDFAIFAVVLLASHLGLLAWETRSLSITLAAPGLRPALPSAYRKEKP